MNAYFKTRVKVTDSGCWEWQQYCRPPYGYGRAAMRSYAKGPVSAHRLSYHLHVGPIPEGMTVDHLCFNPPCVNPEHLRLLTPSENSANQRLARRTHCGRGHEYVPGSFRIGSKGGRSCRRCDSLRQRERAMERRAQAAVVGRGAR